MLSKERILLVDGDEGIRKSLSLYFESRGCRLHTAENGEQALNSIWDRPYDIIVCEEFLPDMNGRNLFRILNKNHDKSIKILITLYGNGQRLEDMQEQGVDSLLTKPFSGDNVEETMLKLINAR
jgi:DNA-binding NtrC family response regulator